MQNFSDNTQEHGNGQGETRGPRAAIYVRTASAQEGVGGTAAQQAICERWAEAHQYTVMQVFTDIGVSGASLERKGLSALRASVRRAEVDVVIVASVDRLARYVGDQIVVIQELEWSGTSIALAQMDGAARDTAERLNTGLMAVMAELVREQFVARMAQARAAACARRAALAIDPAVVRTVFTLYATGDGEGPLTAAQIARRLQQGMPYVVPLRAALYARAASAEARSAQLAALETAALAAGWMVTRQVTDVADSTGLDRPSLTQLRDAARAGTIEILLVTGLDRLTRDAHELALLQDELGAAGCTIVVGE